MPDIKSFYASVLSQALSPCEELLAAGTNYGNVNIFNLEQLDDSEGKPCEFERSKPQLHFSVGKKPVQSMVSSSDALIVGGRNCVSGFSWEGLKQLNGVDKDVQPSWKIDLHLPSNFGSKETVDCIVVGDATTIYTGCGDNNIYKVDLEYGKVTQTLTGHEDIIHSMSFCGNRLSSASEDGTVCLWDMRKSKLSHRLTPSSESTLARRNLGKWIAAVSMTEDWLVCGGGPHLSLYHLRSMTLSQVLLEEDPNGINCVMFEDESIIVGMDTDCVYHLLFSGDITVQMPTSPLRVYSMAVQKTRNKLTVGGAGNMLDNCNSCKFQDQLLHCVS